MGRIRSFIRRAARPASMVAVAGLLAVSLTVTTTQRAEANPVAVLPVVAAAESIVGGASLPLVLPSVFATSLALHPVGWAIAGGVLVAGLAVGAWYSKDYWLPYVTGLFGGATTDKPYGGSAADVLKGFRLGGLTVSGTGNRSLSMAWTYSAPVSGSKTAHIYTVAQCKQLTAVTGKPVGTVWTMVFDWTLGVSPTSTSGAMTTTNMCSTSSEMIGLTASSKATGGYNGPENVNLWGTDSAATAFDPRGSDVKYKTTSECIADDGTKSSISAEWLGSDGAAKFPSCAAAGKGHGTGVNKIEGYAPSAPGVVGTTPETIWSTGAPAVDPNYDKCGPERPGSGCKMAITVDGNPCKVGQWECEHWSELKNDPNWGPRLGCTYGPYSLTLEQCAVMEPAYRPGGAPVTEENIDGDPNTRNNTQPGGGTFTPAQPATVPGGAASGVPDGSTPEQAECFPSGWGILNPVEWVMKPVGCALDAAFKPKNDVQARLTSMQTRFSTKVPITWFGGGVENVSGGACPSSWAIDVAGQHVPLICGTPAEPIILAFRPVLGAMLIVAALWPLIRSLFYAAIPILKVNPS